MAMLGCASGLWRDDIGALAKGLAADFIGVKLNSLGLAGGAVHDPLAPPLLCRVDQVDLSVIHGQIVVQDGALTSLPDLQNDRPS